MKPRKVSVAAPSRVVVNRGAAARVFAWGSRVSDSASASATRVDLSGRQVVIWSAYTVLAIAMIWSRFAAIGKSLWEDEIFTVQHYVVPGPSASFGHYGTNDHILFSVLAWLTVHLPSAGDSAYRLWSIVPFIAAVAILTGWLHRRAGVVVALIFALLATASTQLLILSTEARGYGLAFLAMALLTIAAYEASAQESSGWLSLFAAAGVLGCWTLPTFVLPLAGASGVLLIQRHLRRRLLNRLAAVCFAVGGWYAIPAPALIHSSGQQFGARLAWHGPITGGATEFATAFIPTISLLGGLLAAVPVLVFGLFAARRAMPHIVTVTVAPVIFTFFVLTLGRLFVEPRFVSYLLVPIFIWAAFGFKALLTPRSSRSWIAAACYSGSMLSIIAGLFVPSAAIVARLPEEANREAADAVAATLKNATRPVILNTEHPENILYYLPKHVAVLRAPPGGLEDFICSRRFEITGLIFVQQPFLVDLVDTSCLVRHGGKVRVFRQWGRGLRISVWEIPPEAVVRK
ncbi:MAG: hypothetical protein QOF27_1165 [Gaiellaceae bacterium]|nr:hypothetical protein [Gaiellaceae bacterium]